MVEGFDKQGRAKRTATSNGLRKGNRVYAATITRGAQLEGALHRMGLRMSPGVDQQRADFIDQLAAKYRKES